MILEQLPTHREYTVVIGTSVRKPLAVLDPYLAALNWQELPPGVKIRYIFVDDCLDPQASALLHAFVDARGGEVLPTETPGVVDFSDTHPTTHQWSPTAMERVGLAKNRIFQRALDLKADAVFLVDADLILDKTTLWSLWYANKPIATAVYWTYWHKQASETRQLHAAPQVWLTHPYQLEGRGMDEAEFRQRLINRTLTRVWGFGACTLIRSDVLRAGISFAYLPDVPRDGMMAGEDRHFCIRAERAHIDAWADPWPDVFHIYHPDDLATVPEMMQRLGADHPQQARLGDLVSLRLHALEPMPAGPGRYQQVPPLFLRGRLGTLALMPELEEAIVGLKRGGVASTRVHFPIHYPMVQLRNRTRLIEVTLVDVKPYGFPPVVENELYVGSRLGGILDQTTLTTDQNLSIREVAGV